MIESSLLDDAGLVERIHAVRAAIEACDCTPLIEFAPPVPEDEIESAEARLGRRFPPGHRNFLMLHDGASLGVGLYIRSVPVQFRLNILRTRDIIARTAQARQVWPEVWDGKLAFAEYPDGNLCGFDAPAADGESPVIDVPSANPLLPQVIAESFDHWLQRVFEAPAERSEHFTYWIPKKIHNI